MSPHRAQMLKLVITVLVICLVTLSCNLPFSFPEPPVPTLIEATSAPLRETLSALMPVSTATPGAPAFTATPALPTLKPSPTLTPLPVVQPITAKNAANLAAARKWGAGTIRKVELSPDETTLLVASSQGLYYFDLATLKTIWRVITHFAVRDAIFTPDGKTIVAVGDTNDITLWDAANGAALKKLAGHTDWVNTVDISPDGRLATAGRDKTIILWDLAAVKPLRKIAAHTDTIHSLRFSANGKTLISGSADMFLKVWDVEKGTNLKALTGHQTAIYSVDLTASGDTAISSSASGEIFVWDVVKGTRLYTFKPTTGETYLRLSRDGMRFSAGFTNGNITIYTLNDGKEEVTLTAHTGLARSMTFTTKGKRLVSAAFDGTVKVWDIPNRSFEGEITGFSAYIQDMALAANAPLLAVGASNQLKWLNPTTLELVKFAAAPDTQKSVAITRDGKLAASGGTTDIILWDSATGKEKMRLKGHIKTVNDLAFSPDERFLASASDDQSIIVWDVASGKQVIKFTGFPQEIYSLLYSPDGKYLLAGGRTEAVFVYNMTTNKKETELWLGADSTYELLWLPNGNLAGASYGSIWVADVSTAKVVKKLTGFTMQVNGLALSPDGSLLAGGDYDGRIMLFDTATWQPVKTLTEHWGMNWGIAFSADGKALYTNGGGDGSVILWNVK